MFLDFKHSKYIGYNEETKTYDHLHLIEDTDFQVEIRTVALSHLIKTQLILKLYEERNQDVALNIMLYFLHLKRKFGFFIPQSMDWADKHLPEYRKYLSEMERYAEML